MAREEITLHDTLAIYFAYYKYIKAPNILTPYIDLLPDTFHNIFYFNEEEFNLLEASPVAGKNVKKRF